MRICLLIVLTNSFTLVADIIQTKINKLLHIRPSISAHDLLGPRCLSVFRLFKFLLLLKLALQRNK